MQRAAKLLLACTGLALCTEALASYGQMKLDGIGTALFLFAFWLWGFIVAVFALVGWYRNKILLGVTLAISALLLWVVIYGWDGAVYMRPRPISTSGFMVIRMFIAIPLVFIIPVMLYLQAQRGEARKHLGVVLLLGFLLVPFEAMAWAGMQTLVAELVEKQARAATPGTVQAHVQQSREFSSRIPFKPWVWTEREGLKYTMIGIANLDFVRSAEPLLPADREAVRELIASSGDLGYGWRLEGKLLWDEFLQTPSAQRPALAARITPSSFSPLAREYIVPYADRLCPQLDQPTQQAVHAMLLRVLDEYRDMVRKALKQKCGWDDWEEPKAPPARIGAVSAKRPVPSAGSAGLTPPPTVQRP